MSFRCLIPFALAAALICPLPSNALPTKVEWDKTSLILDGERVAAVMAEVHYSRIPAEEWEEEIQKIKDGGVTIIATYAFWNHHEEVEGQFDWSGQRDLRRFLEICKDKDMPVVLRIGPFCHGEVRNGGIPDYIFDLGCKTRSLDPVFLRQVTKLYRQIFTQVQGLQHKDGGPVVAVQFDNEYRGHGTYLVELKKIANEIGYDLPFYTRTGWPKLASPVPFGEMIPLYGDYADGFWERSIEPCAGDYYKAFNFKNFRGSTAIATEQLGKQTETTAADDNLYPYFTCELGGGMANAYHRRPYMYPQDAYSMAIVKLGSGSNLLGYYMYHGGTNPEGRLTTLNEHQGTRATNYNDMPVKSYEFQAPIGEFGQLNPHYYMLRQLHLFMADYGDVLAPMEPVFPAEENRPKGDDSSLRWAYRTDGERAFVFVNNYERLQNLSPKKSVKFDVAGVTFPSRPITIPADCSCIFPVNIDDITYATAQIVAKRDGKVYLAQIPGVHTEIKYDGRVMKNVKPLGADTPVAGNIYLLSADDALRFGLDPEAETATDVLSFTKMRESTGPHTIKIGVNKAATAPTDADFECAASYIINLPTEREGRLLNIEYRGDCARLYADGKLIEDDFYNGRPMAYALWRLPEGVNQLELRILPLQTDMPVYFPAEADTSATGEEVRQITVTYKP